MLQRPPPTPAVMDDADLIAQASALADQLLAASDAVGSARERRREGRLRRILTSDAGTRLVFALADRALRPVDPVAGVGQLTAIARNQLAATDAALGPADRAALPLGPADRGMLALAAVAGRVAPAPVMAAVAARLRLETRELIWPVDDRRLTRRLTRLRRAGRRANLNLLGEAILGDDEAERRVAAVEALVGRPDVDCMSVKISSVASSLSLLDERGSEGRIAEPLRQIYRAAQRSPTRPMVNLDMEEHRDLDLTVAVFRQLLDEPEFALMEGGIAVQAYLPDTHAAVAELLEWSAGRAARTGAGIRVRLVKGANLAMERVDAELHGWPQAPYPTKADTDASYLRLLDELIRPEHPQVRVGVASHNLFDIAAALTLGRRRGVSERVEVEMLAGMAERQAVATAALTGGILVYVPVSTRRDFRSAMAYLARRLDENSTPEGFLRHALDLRPGSRAWAEQRTRFEDSVRSRHAVAVTPAQTQDRTVSLAATQGVAVPTDSVPADLDRSAPSRRGRSSGFTNAADTDLSVAANRAWARTAVTGGSAVAAPPAATVADVTAAINRATGAAGRWARSTTSQRRSLLVAAVAALRARRTDAVAVMADEAGKTFAEGDPEVSEAIDYASWYAAETALFDEVATEAVATPLGVVVVAPPWNFPYAIPAGGVLATLAAGGAAILKPSPRSPRTAAVLVEALWAAGVPDDLVQLVAAPDDAAGRRLIEDPAVGTVVLTGAWETARTFQRWRPDLRLLAETSGKNSMVVSATADVDQAVADLVRSAFGHAGQKCSATSLAIVDASVHDRSPFLRQLADAVRSLRVGPATDPATEIGPIVGPTTESLERALTELDPGESWLVAPRRVDAGARLWSPGVRTGVRPGSWAHRTEWFGPVLAVMRADTFDQAVEAQNAVAYGLTAGLQSTDPAEQARWAAVVEAGNLYVNRTTTGAIVGRQPFGGWKRSAWGPTAKAGGPGYLAALSRWRDPGDAVPLDRVEASYRSWWARHGSTTTEMAGLAGEANELSYHPLPGVVLRAGGGAPDAQLIWAALAARVTGTPLEISVAPERRPVRVTGIPVRVETAAELGNRLGGDGRRLRLVGDTEPEVLVAAAEAGVSVLAAPVLANGRVELGRWLREKVVSRSRHRYGNIVG